MTTTILIIIAIVLVIMYFKSTDTLEVRIVSDTTINEDGTFETLGYWVESRTFLLWENRGYFDTFAEAVEYRKKLLKGEEE